MDKTTDETFERDVILEKLDLKMILFKQFDRANWIATVNGGSVQFINAVETLAETLIAYTGDVKLIGNLKDIDKDYAPHLRNAQKKEFLQLQIEAINKKRRACMLLINEAGLSGSRGEETEA